jgi:hypothetical protein
MTPIKVVFGKNDSNCLNSKTTSNDLSRFVLKKAPTDWSRLNSKQSKVTPM